MNENYGWVVNASCGGHKILHYDQEKMLQMIGKKTIMMVGDSINSRQLSSMRYALATNPPCEDCNGCEGEDSASNLLVEGSGYSFRLIGVRNDYLTLQEPFIHGAVQPWTDKINKYQVSTLILNRGAHFRMDWDVIHDLHETFDYLAKHHPNVTVIFRNTYPGHINHHGLFEATPLEVPQNFSILPYHWACSPNMARASSTTKQKHIFIAHFQLLCSLRHCASNKTSKSHFIAFNR